MWKWACLAPHPLSLFRKLGVAMKKKPHAIQGMSDLTQRLEKEKLISFTFPYAPYTRDFVS